MNELTKIKNGLELDEIDLTKLFSEKTSISIKKQSNEEPTNQLHKLYRKVAEVSLAKLMLLSTSMALLILSVYFLWGRPSIDPSKLSYAAVGPVMTTIGSGQSVRVKLKFEFKDPNLRNRITAMEALIKDKVLMILASLDEKDISGEKSIKSLKDRIESVVDSIVKNNGIENIYFSEIQIFDRHIEM